MFKALRLLALAVRLWFVHCPSNSVGLTERCRNTAPTTTSHLIAAQLAYERFLEQYCEELKTADGKAVALPPNFHKLGCENNL
jgi:hypothetical protein